MSACTLTDSSVSMQSAGNTETVSQIIRCRPRIFSMTSRSISMQGRISLQQIPTFRGFYRPLQHLCDFRPMYRYGWPIFC